MAKVNKYGPRKQAMTPEAWEDAAEQIRVEQIIIRGLGKPELLWLEHAELAALGIDDYQRIHMRAWSNKLFHVLRAGGEFPAPLILAQRADKSRWIVDGQQRVKAAQEHGSGSWAVVWRVKNYQQEADMFLVLQNIVKVAANYIVHSWSGTSGVVVRGLNDTPSSPLYQKIRMATAGGGSFGAYILCKSLYAMLLGSRAQSGPHELLATLSRAMEEDPQRELKVKMFADIVARAFDGLSYVPALPMLGMGKVAHERWAKRVLPPTAKAIAWIRRINWNDPEFKHKHTTYLPVFEERIKRYWVEPAR